MTKGNPYGRMLSLMRQQSAKETSAIPLFEVGRMITGAQIKLDGKTLARDDYILIENRFTVTVGNDRKTFKVPYKKEQEMNITAMKNSSTAEKITITVPPLKKGDLVLCLQISDQKYAVFGRVVES